MRRSVPAAIVSQFGRWRENHGAFSTGHAVSWARSVSLFDRRRLVDSLFRSIRCTRCRETFLWRCNARKEQAALRLSPFFYPVVIRRGRRTGEILPLKQARLPYAIWEQMALSDTSLLRLWARPHPPIRVASGPARAPRGPFAVWHDEPVEGVVAERRVYKGLGARSQRP